ncbi:6,7-dimethyl-8-ribityllumazine synthase [Candidatus Gracilibacteria bacterium CG2_30_37_12]|nr:MAG: 6,7-dimethyl-8-ribityllumazine synthase [Candidatus Gracilibacteria bacterium CG2_30_37_12]
MSDYKSSLKNIESLDKNIRIAFITGEFNRNYTEQLENINKKFLEENGFKNIDMFLVPGVFEIPGFTSRLLDTDTYDLIICFGVVIRGDTPHFDYVCNESSRGLMDLTMAYETPIIFGILTCNDEEQVKVRIIETYAVSGLNLLSEIAKIPE